MSKPHPEPGPLRALTESIRGLRARHEERWKPTGFGMAFADRIDYLDPATWDRVTARGTLFLRPEMLRVWEQHGPANIVPRYALIFRAAKPVAALAAQIVAVSGEQLTPPGKPTAEKHSARGLIRRALSPAARAARATLRERILIAGNLLSWGFHGIALDPDEDPVTIWPAIAEALYRIRRAERLTGQTDFVMVKDVTGQQKGLDALRRFSYRPLETEPDMVLSIDPAWRDYDHYLAALDAKYRKNAKDQLKKLHAAGCRLEPLQQLKPVAARLHELYRSVQGHAAVRLVTLGETCLPALAEAMGDSFRCTAIRRGEEILGFATCLRDGPTAIGYYLGFDRNAAAEGLPLYLRLLHSTIGHAIGWGCERLSLGRTALEPKAALGARPEPMSVWLRHRVPALNWVLRGVLGAVPHDEAPRRNPFKSVAP